MRNINSRKLNAGLVALAAFSSVLVTGCSSEGIVDAPDKVPITLTATIEGPTSKSVSSTLQDAAFEEGEQIKADVYGTVCTYTVGTGGALTGTSPVYISSSVSRAYIYGWYPADAFTSKDLPVPAVFTVASNQSSDDNYKKSDLMLALNYVTYTSPSATLEFNHRLSKIVVNLACNVDGTDKSSDAKVEMIDVYTKAKTNSVSVPNPPLEAVLQMHMSYTADTSEDAPKSDIVMKDPTVNTSKSIAAIIPPQTVAAGTKFFRITLNGTTYTAALDNTSDYTFKAENEYVFTITLGQANATVSKSEVSAWSAGNYTTSDKTGESIGL